MNNFTNLAEKVRNYGLAKKENWLDKSDQNKIVKIISSIKPKKGSKKSWLSINLSSHLIKIIKLDFKNLSRSLYFINLAKKLKLKIISDNIFNCESKLAGIDFYYNVKSNDPVLDWHCDTAYSGKKDVTNFIDPNNYSIKFFFYLTDVSTDNGCLSYIPNSNKVTHALKRGIFEKKLNYSPYWSLEDYKKTVLIDKNYNYIKNILGQKYFDDFIEKVNLILENKKKTNIYDNEIKKGGAIIFDETGIHRGSKTSINDRMALRFFYKKI
jgi:ectoine hydroxylase-related dioxygenase (phytanoyl-CoA dioxygenase family)